VNKARRTIVLIIATLLVASCSLFSDKEDEELLPKELVKINESIKIKRIWSAKLGDDAEFLRVALRPAGDGTRIYAASRDGKVTAFDPATGKQIWRTELELELSAGPAAGEGRVAVAAKDGFGILLDAATGDLQWRVDIAAESLATPLIKNDTVIFQTIDNRLDARSLFDGRERWTHVESPPALSMRGSSSPVSVRNTVLAGFDSGRIVAANIDTGEVIWESLLSPPTGRSDLDRLSDIDGAMTLVGQDLYAAGYQGRLAAMASESGQILWNREISSYAGVAADWNSVYTVRDNGELIAMTRSNGTETWRNDSLLRREPTVPMPFNTTVVVGDFEGYLHFFSAINGEAVARERVGSAAITSDPFVVANRLYVQSDSGKISAFVVVDDRPTRTAPDVAEDGS
jgi:outer membrane protein assembly factor BamB